MREPVKKAVPWVTLLLRVGVGGILLWAGLAKIHEPALFAQTVRAYDIAPLAWIHVFAVAMPWMEISVGAFLILGIWTRNAALGALGLLLSFGVSLGVNLYRGADFDCGCFGFDGAGGSIESALVKDVLLILASIYLLRQSVEGKASLGSWLEEASQRVWRRDAKSVDASPIARGA